MGSLADLMPAAAWNALEADIAELQRAVSDDKFSEELRTRKVSPHTPLTILLHVRMQDFCGKFGDDNHCSFW